ncbi:S-4TM family putative pore-forming effector, partial [Nostoc sp. NIES-2111]
WHKARMKAAAKMQEEFDCAVLDMHPNDFLVGGNVDPEEVFDQSKKPFDPTTEAQLRDWYPIAVDKVPLHVGRILCQRENLLYDSDVRKTYARVLRVGLAAVFLALFYYSLAAGLQLDAVVLTVWVPAMPAITWALREIFRQADTVETLSRLKSESEKLWKSAAAGPMAPEAAAERSRELQDAIYSHRVSSPLVFDFLYR